MTRARGAGPPFRDLQTFLRYLEDVGDLKRIQVEVDPALEATEIATRMVLQDGPAFLIERPTGSRYPLALNVLAAPRRIEWALGRPPGEIGEDLVNILDHLNPPSLKGLWRTRSQLRRLLTLRTRTVRRGPCQEVADPPDLSPFPIQTCWPGDGGRFITFGLVITRDPLLGDRNLGIYRLHVYGPDRTGMHWQIQKGGGFHYARAEREGQALPVAVAVGADPALLLAAVAPLPEGLDEVVFSGLLRGRPTELVRGRTVPLEVPAHAELILEGEVAPGERDDEGPFGDHFGHYSHPASFPVFHLKTITRRKSPVYLGTVVGKPPQEDRYLGEAVQEMLRPLIRIVHPEVRDLWAHYEAGFHNLLAVSVWQRYAKEGMKTALGLLGEGQLSLSKVLILVDEAVDPRDLRSVFRALARHFDPKEDFLLLPGVPLDTLDFTSYTLNLGSKMILDATEGGEAVRDPPSIGDPRSLDHRIRASRLLEDALLAVQVEGEAREVLSRLIAAPDLRGVPIIAAVSPDVDLDDRVSLLWGLFTRFDCARDVLFPEVSLRGAWPTYRGPMGIDATFKSGYPDPIVMDDAVVRNVDERWASYWS